MTPAQQARREALAKRVYGMCWPQEAGWPTWCGAHEVAQRRAESVADFIIAEQERREGPLVKCIEENALALACSGNGNPVNVARIRAALASAPGGTAALREVALQVAGAVWAAAAPSREMDANQCAAIVSRILGERSDDAPQGRGERAKGGGDD